MSRLVSIGTMLAQIAGLSGTDDLTEWESDFVESVQHRAGGDTSRLTEKQVETIERIWKKHFA